MPWWLLGIVLLLGGCDASKDRVSGYVEAVYVDYSAPVSGRLTYRPRYEGETIVEGDMLFQLSENPESDQLMGVEAELEKANWELRDLEKGLRADDLAYLQANVDSSEVECEYWEQNVKRLEKLSPESRSEDEMDQARKSLGKARSKLEGAKAKLKSGKLGERSDLILAKRASIKAMKAKKQELEWYLEQKKRNIHFSGRVKEIYYEIGEWVKAYQPIMTIEAVNRRQVIFYLNQMQLDQVTMGDTVTVISSNQSQSMAKIVFISDHAEFTPPIVYTTSQGELYRFKVKAELQSSRFLHPGQPVSIEL